MTEQTGYVGIETAVLKDGSSLVYELNSREKLAIVRTAGAQSEPLMCIETTDVDTNLTLVNRLNALGKTHGKFDAREGVLL